MFKKVSLFLITPIILGNTVMFLASPHSKQLKATQLFVEKKLSRSDYGIKTTYHLPPTNHEYATGEEVLSESMGLMMLHYVYTQNKASFERLRLFCEERLKNDPIYVYREGFSTNALIDDLRIVEALFLAAETFDNPLYQKQALDYANVLYETNLSDGHLVDFYDIQYHNRNNFLTLCYANFKLLTKLSTYDSRWYEILEATKAIVKSGYISDSFPLYRNNFNYDSHTYNEDSIHIIHGLKTLFHLAQINDLPVASLDWLKQRVADGTLYGSYSTTGEVLTDIQSTAAYALAARIAAAINDHSFYEQCIQRMEQYKITDQSSEMYGAFGNAETGEAYSFDQLSALLAYDAQKAFHK